MAKTSILIIFRVSAAPKSWSKHTTLKPFKIVFLKFQKIKSEFDS